MKAPRVHPWLIASGGVLVLPGLLWMATSGRRINEAESAAAFRALLRIPLAQVADQPASRNLTIPDTPAWRKLLEVWGNPVFSFQVEDPGTRPAPCLAKLPVRLSLLDAGGHVVALQPGGYAYLTDAGCAFVSTRKAGMGDSFTVVVAGTAARTLENAGAGLTVSAAWENGKDRIVGVALDGLISRSLCWTAALGVLLCLTGAALRAWRHK